MAIVDHRCVSEKKRILRKAPPPPSLRPPGRGAGGGGHGKMETWPIHRTHPRRRRAGVSKCFKRKATQHTSLTAVPHTARIPLQLGISLHALAKTKGSFDRIDCECEAVGVG